VLVGESSGDGLQVLGRGEASSGGSVIKGEIVDMDRALELLTEALEMADENSGKMINQSRAVGVVVTNSGISSLQSVGSAVVRAQDYRVSESDITEATRNANVNHLPFERLIIGSFDSYFLLDGHRKVSSPLGQSAHRLDAYVHVIHGETNRIENFSKIMQDVGFEDNVYLIFSGLATTMGILTEDEKRNGAILLDMGAGTTEYVTVYNHGIMASGVIPVGFDHVLNDLSVILKLHIDTCRKLITDGTLAAMSARGQGFIELKNLNSATVKIPLVSFEKIIDERLKETFGVIKSNLQSQGLFTNIGSGGILSGGAALFPHTLDVYRDVFECPVRVGKPFDASGAITQLENPRYSTIWGALKYCDVCMKSDEQRSGGFTDSISSALDTLAQNFQKTFANVVKSLKI
jgi:cell division protein FtsA